MNLNIKTFSENTSQGKRDNQLLYFTPNFNLISRRIAKKHGYMTSLHPAYKMLNEIDKEVDTNFISRDKVKRYLISNIDYKKKFLALKEKTIETNKEIKKLKSILKLLRVSSDSVARYNK